MNVGHQNDQKRKYKTLSENNIDKYLKLIYLFSRKLQNFVFLRSRTKVSTLESQNFLSPISMCI